VSFITLDRQADQIAFDRLGDRRRSDPPGDRALWRTHERGCAETRDRQIHSLPKGQGERPWWAGRSYRGL